MGQVNALLVLLVTSCSSSLPSEVKNSNESEQSPAKEETATSARGRTHARVCADIGSEPLPCEFAQVKGLPRGWTPALLETEAAEIHAIGSVAERGKSSVSLALVGTFRDGNIAWEEKERWEGDEPPVFRGISSEALLLNDRGQPLRSIQRSDGRSTTLTDEPVRWAALNNGTLAVVHERSVGRGTLSTGAWTATGEVPPVLEALEEVASGSIPQLNGHVVYFAQAARGESHRDQCAGERPYLNLLRASTVGGRKVEELAIDSKIIDFQGLVVHEDRSALLLGVESEDDGCRRPRPPAEAESNRLTGEELMRGAARECIPDVDVDIALQLTDAQGDRTVLLGTEALDRPVSIARGMGDSQYWVSWCAARASVPFCYLAHVDASGTTAPEVDLCTTGERPHRLVHTEFGVLSYAYEQHEVRILSNTKN